MNSQQSVKIQNVTGAVSVVKPLLLNNPC